jgi:coatomer subunit beta'
MHLRCYNYNTLERVHQFEAHSDYIRSIAVHPTQPFILTSSGGYITCIKVRGVWSYGC